MEQILLFVIIGLKFIVPISMLSFPMVGMWSNYFLDIIDGDVLMSLGLAEYSYQTIDKIADLFSYFFMLFLGIRFRIKNTIIVLFVYRLIGQIMFFTTRNELVFFFFQNLLEPLLLIYTIFLFKFKSDEKAYAFYRKHIILVWIIVLCYKIWNEWYLHYANIDLSTLFFGINGGNHVKLLVKLLGVY